MGLGGAIYEENTQSLLYSFCISGGQGSKNLAELSALLHALNSIVQLEKSVGSILFKLDSQLLYCQLFCGSGLENELSGELYKEILNVISELGCSVKFQWVPSDGNRLSNALAYKAAGMPFAEVKDHKVILWDRHFADQEAEQASLPPINPDTYVAIQKLNCTKHADLSLIFSLMTYGIDKYSRAKLDLLLIYIEMRFGSYTRDYVVRVLENLDTYYSKNVIRWTARGLNPDLAFIKARLETEIRE